MSTHPVTLFVKGIFSHWWALMSCAAFTFLGIWTAYANRSREWVLWSSFSLSLVFLLVAAYRTWLAEHRHLLTTLAENHRLLTNLEAAGAENQALRQAQVQNENAIKPIVVLRGGDWIQWDDGTKELKCLLTNVGSGTA